MRELGVLEWGDIRLGAPPPVVAEAKPMGEEERARASQAHARSRIRRALASSGVIPDEAWLDTWAQRNVIRGGSQ